MPDKQAQGTGALPEAGVFRYSDDIPAEAKD
jgi:hypothetical protein